MLTGTLLRGSFAKCRASLAALVVVRRRPHKRTTSFVGRRLTTQSSSYSAQHLPFALRRWSSRLAGGIRRRRRARPMRRQPANCRLVLLSPCHSNISAWCVLPCRRAMFIGFVISRGLKARRHDATSRMTFIFLCPIFHYPTTPANAIGINMGRIVHWLYFGIFEDASPEESCLCDQAVWPLRQNIVERTACFSPMTSSCRR